MGIADDYRAGPPKRARRSNILREFLAGLSDVDREAALQMLGNPEWKTRPVFESFTRGGLKSSFSHFDRLRADRAWE